MEFLTISGVYEACLFFSGVFFYRIISSMLNLGHGALMIKSMTEDGLRLARLLVEDLEVLLEIKQDILKSSDFPEEYVSIAKKLDRNIVSDWKSGFIKKINATFSKRFKAVARFNSWEEAMDFLEGRKND